MSNLQGQRPTNPNNVNAVGVSDAIYHLVGTAVTKLTRPAGAELLVMVADSGTFRARIGDLTGGGMPSAVNPNASVTDGSGAIAIGATRVVMPAPALITVKGFNGTDVLTYYWL